MKKFEDISQSEFDAILQQIVSEMSAEQILQQHDVYEWFSEYFNNEVAKRFEAGQKPNELDIEITDSSVSITNNGKHVCHWEKSEFLEDESAAMAALNAVNLALKNPKELLERLGLC